MSRADSSGTGTGRRANQVAQALNAWFASGYRRTGDRLPTELELASSVGVCRNTVRKALRQLEEQGAIVRRRGSGTFVARSSAPALHLGSAQRIQLRLESLEPYGAVALRQGFDLSWANVAIERRAVGPRVGSVLGLPLTVHAITVSRTMLANGIPVAAVMEVIHPRALVTYAGGIKSVLHGGEMLVDALLEAGPVITSSRARVFPVLLTPTDPEASALGVTQSTPVLRLEEMVHRDNECFLYARQIFAPDRIDLTVSRAWDPPSRRSGLAPTGASPPKPW